MSRPDWDTYFLGIATAASKRSDCERSKVGAVVVRDNRVRATGYNGAPAGAAGCDTCPRRLAEVVPGVSPYDSGPTRCVSVHAEANALLYCDREDLIGATLYITREPCVDCEKLIAAAGIERTVTPYTMVRDAVGKKFDETVFFSNPIAVRREAELMQPVYSSSMLQFMPEPKPVTNAHAGTFGDLRNGKGV